MTHEDGIAFCEKVMALLDSARFTASYKHAVLLAIIDLCMEGVGEDGRTPAALRGKEVGRRVFEIYWRQARPLAGKRLRQSTQRGDLVTKIEQFKHSNAIAPTLSLAEARSRYPLGVSGLEKTIVTTVIRMPLPKLQRFGTGAGAAEDRFIYEFHWADEVPARRVWANDFDDRLTFQGDASHWLVTFSGLLRPLIQQHWAVFVAGRNRDHLDDAYLHEFLFGVSRASLQRVRRPLAKAQKDRCFYCRRRLGSRIDVDHFLPWQRHADNDLFNLVGTHPRCNNAKRSALAAVSPHLGRWTERIVEGSPPRRELEKATLSMTWPRNPERTLNSARAMYLWLPEDALLWSSDGKFVRHDAGLARSLLAPGHDPTTIEPRRAAETPPPYGDPPTVGEDH